MTTINRFNASRCLLKDGRCPKQIYFENKGLKGSEYSQNMRYGRIVNRLSIRPSYWVHRYVYQQVGAFGNAPGTPGPTRLPPRNMYGSTFTLGK